MTQTQKWEMQSSVHGTLQDQGLNDEQVLRNRTSFGTNKLDGKGKTTLTVFKNVVAEPMFVLLSATCLIYFLSGNSRDAILMAAGLLIISVISFFQERKSNSAINALRRLSAPKVRAYRNGILVNIPKEEVVSEDVITVEEGDIISADGEIITSHDFSVNEAVLTGESFPVFKSTVNSKEVFSGTMVLSGFATIKVTAVGKRTRLGLIRKLVSEAKAAKTPLQMQIAGLVRRMVVIGVIAFFVVVFYNYVSTNSLTKAILTGLTLAMSILPEEIPVAVTTFQALGAYRLHRKNIIVKLPQHVEALGSTTILCVDKTGTLTQNLMTISCIYDVKKDLTLYTDKPHDLENISGPLLEAAMLASELHPFDAMEKSIHRLYENIVPMNNRPIYQQVHEYPISGDPPFMTHIYLRQGEGIVIAAKGAPEALINHTTLSAEARRDLANKVSAFATLGMRVLGVGVAQWTERPWPGSQEEFVFDLLGLLAFHDPPIENIHETIKNFYLAGVKVKMITGDYSETAVAVAKKIGLKNAEEILSGTDISQYSDEALRSKVQSVNVYVRMSPEAKVRVVNALVENGEVVAMTGDGVNDAPALKVANVGVAMGVRGSEVAKNAAALVIADDDLTHMIDAIAIGRKISENIRKSIRYIISIHVPIILIVMLPLILDWKFSTIFLPIHIVFLEVIMGITCSIVYENEPVEPGSMLQPPEVLKTRFLTSGQLLISILQGVIMAIGCLGLGYWFMATGSGEEETRSVIFLTLLFCNVLLTMVNRSFKVSILQSLQYKNRLMFIALSIFLCVIPVLFFWNPVSDLFKLQDVQPLIIIIAALIAIFSTLWIEPFKKQYFLKKMI